MGLSKSRTAPRPEGGVGLRAFASPSMFSYSKIAVSSIALHSSGQTGDQRVIFSIDGIGRRSWSHVSDRRRDMGRPENASIWRGRSDAQPKSGSLQASLYAAM